MSSLRQTPLTCSGHTRPVVDLSFSEATDNGFYLISACKDGKPMLRQGDTGDWIGTFEGHKGAVWSATLNREATKAATGAADFSAKLWDALSGDEIHTFTHKHIVKSVAFSSDGQRLLTGSNEKILRIFDLNKPEAESLVFSGHTSNIRSAIFCPGDNKVISASDDRTIRIWDVGTQQEVQRVDLEGAPNSMELSPDGKVLTIPYKNLVSFWDTDRLEQLKRFELPCTVFSASLHAERTSFVCGGEDFKIYKYAYEDGAELESFKGHFGPVHCVRFSADGELYASGSEDGTLRLWQTTVGKTYGLWRCTNPDDDDVIRSES